MVSPEIRPKKQKKRLESRCANVLKTIYR